MTKTTPSPEALKHAIFSQHDKPERWVALDEIEQFLPDPEFYALFVEVWTNSESNDLNLGLIDRLIDRRGVHANVVMPVLSDEDRRLMTMLRRNPRICRGATLERPYSDYSWSVDRGKALWFANRCSDATPVMIEGIADTEKVLFTYMGRGESEVAIRTCDVHDKLVNVIGPYRRCESFEIFSAVQRGGDAALFDPLVTLQMRLMHQARTRDVTEKSLMAEMEAWITDLEDMGFKAMPQKKRELVARIDWSTVMSASD
ncbi:hypothetical protein JYP52_21520 [Nitratireductor aquibiodomus]|uniref:hypothetical protein n=1 Tax=Nitratireductor TaxID=245876 RepID=UPI000DDDB71C|nr:MULTISPECIES: hypothetical protein [Nitratireductor]MBN7763722.1 hypothetical protein [Nitratireductor aquibiodomus]